MSCLHPLTWLWTGGDLCYSKLITDSVIILTGRPFLLNMSTSIITWCPSPACPCWMSNLSCCRNGHEHYAYVSILKTKTKTKIKQTDKRTKTPMQMIFACHTLFPGRKLVSPSTSNVHIKSKSTLQNHFMFGYKVYWDISEAAKQH